MPEPSPYWAVSELRRVVVVLGSGEDACRLVGAAGPTGPICSIETADGVTRNVARWRVVETTPFTAPTPGPSGGDPDA